MAEVGLCDLPTDVQLHCLRYCDWTSLASASCCSRLMRSLSKRLNCHPRWQSAMSLRDPNISAAEVVDELLEQLRGPSVPHLALMFVSAEWEPELGALAGALVANLPPMTKIVGCAAGAVIGTTAMGQTIEEEEGPAVAVTLVHLPGSTVQTFFYDGRCHAPGNRRTQPAHEEWEAIVASAAEDRPPPHFFLIADGHALLEECSAKCNSIYPLSSKMGGVAGVAGPNWREDRPQLVLATGKEGPGGDVLWGGGVAGLMVQGGVQLEAAVTRGVSMHGRPYHITDAEAVGRARSPTSPGASCIKKVRAEAGDDEIEPLRALIEATGGDVPSPLLVGVKASPEAEAYHVHGVATYSPQEGSITIGGEAAAGDVLAFHAISPESSREELTERLLEVKASMSAAAAREGHSLDPGGNSSGELCIAEESMVQITGAIAVMCSARGEGFHGKPNADTKNFHGILKGTPVTGFFAGGELGPNPAREAGGRDYSTSDILGFTTVFGVFRVKNHE